MALTASIDDLKSSIGRRGGLARANKFIVYFSHPSKKGSLLGGLPTTGFEIQGIAGNIARGLVNGGGVNFNAFLSDPRDLAFLCETTNIPGRSISTQERYTDMKGIKMPYGFLNEDASFTFLCTNDYYPYKYFATWMDSIIKKDNEALSVAYKKEYACDITIVQLGNTELVPVHSVKLINAYPIGISAVELSSASENGLSRVTVQLAYDYQETEGFIEGLVNAAANTLISNIGKIF